MIGPRRSSRWGLRLGALLSSAVVVLLSCAPAAVSPTRPSAAPTQSDTTRQSRAASATEPSAIEPLARPGFRDEDCSVPVSARDPQWGKATAPATIVVFGNLQSPLDRQAKLVLQRVQASYGRDALRVVWKHFPAGVPPASLAAARAAVAVFSLSGNQAFWRFRELALANQAAITSENLFKWATEVGTDPQVYAAAVELSGVTIKLEEDFQLARQLDVRGTPEFFINGQALGRAVSFEAWQRHIDAQLLEARALVARGTPAAELYATLTDLHRPRPAPAPDTATGAALHVEASHILVQYTGAMRAAPSISRSKAEARERIEEVAAKASAGADFAELAVEYSDEPGAAARRGALGRFRRGIMVKPFEEAAFALKIGEVSGVVETDFGFHVIKRTQ